MYYYNKLVQRRIIILVKKFSDNNTVNLQFKNFL